MTTKSNSLSNLIAVGVTIAFTAPALAACQVDSRPTAQVVQVCQDKFTGQFLPDYECDTGLYTRAVPYFMDSDRYETHHHYYPGDRLTGGSTTPPRHAEVRSASRPGRVTVYDGGKQVAVKTNKQANSFGTVTKSQKAANKTYTPAKKAPSWGTPAKPAKKSGKCC